MPADTSAAASSTSRPSASSSSSIRSFTAAEANACVGGDENDNDHDNEREEEFQSLPSPVTSYEEAGYHDEEEGCAWRSDNDEDGAADARLTGYFQDDEAGERDDEYGPWRPWPITLALLLSFHPPPSAQVVTTAELNARNGGSVKDNEEFQSLPLPVTSYAPFDGAASVLIEVPWSLHRSARPRRSPTPSTISTPSPASALHITAVKSQLRSLEILLLTLCVLTPILGVLLLRSLASFTSSSPTPNAAAATPNIVVLHDPLRADHRHPPLRELVSRVSTHPLYHLLRLAATTTKDGELASLRAQLARLEQALADLTARDEALYAYVEDAVAPLEKGVRRVERRVGKLKSNVRKQREEVIVLNNSSTGAGKGKGKGKSGGMTNANTIFVPAAGAAGAEAEGGSRRAGGGEVDYKELVRGWRGGWVCCAAFVDGWVRWWWCGERECEWGKGEKGRRPMLDSIPEEGEGGVYARSSSAQYAPSSSSSAAAPYPSTSTSPPSYYAASTSTRHPFHPHPAPHSPYPHTQQHPPYQYAPQHPAPLVRRWLAAVFLWPVWVVLAPAHCSVLTRSLDYEASTIWTHLTHSLVVFYGTLHIVLKEISIFIEG
ncbi:hypothetical protein R3P38DRAFT_2780533 [Favolaschia claudopus]|uniref:Uncharacterized protein n=1 Tax=Favolaschia claudopus TaxID=2862362 RepID=A0AAW0B948_9AGAR